MRSESMDITESLVLGLGRTNPIAFRYTVRTITLLNPIYLDIHVYICVLLLSFT